LLPICCYCKKVRDDQNYWHEVETYIGARSGTTFSHGICPDCRKKAREDMLGGPPPEGERPQEDAGGIPVKTPG